MRLALHLLISTFAFLSFATALQLSAPSTVTAGVSFLVTWVSDNSSDPKTFFLASGVASTGTISAPIQVSLSQGSLPMTISVTGISAIGAFATDQTNSVSLIANTGAIIVLGGGGNTGTTSKTTTSTTRSSTHSASQQTAGTGQSGSHSESETRTSETSTTSNSASTATVSSGNSTTVSATSSSSATNAATTTSDSGIFETDAQDSPTQTTVFPTNTSTSSTANHTTHTIILIAVPVGVVVILLVAALLVLCCLRLRRRRTRRSFVSEDMFPTPALLTIPRVKPALIIPGQNSPPTESPLSAQTESKNTLLSSVSSRLSSEQTIHSSPVREPIHTVPYIMPYVNADELGETIATLESAVSELDPEAGYGTTATIRRLRAEINRLTAQQAYEADYMVPPLYTSRPPSGRI